MQDVLFDTLTPTSHLIIDDFAPACVIRAAAKTWPDERWAWWHKYDDETALKFSTMGRAPFPPASALLLDRMATLDISSISTDAFPDMSFHAGGMHTLPPGGFLGKHKDAEIHPLTGWSRVLNAILFIEGDGDLHLGQDYAIRPTPGRLVLFETKGVWHRVDEATETRKSLAVYWWADRQEQGDERSIFEKCG